MCMRGWRLATGKDDVGACGKLRYQPGTLGKYDQREHAAKCPPLPGAARESYGDEEQHQRDKFGLVQRGEHDPADVQRNRSGDRACGKPDRRRDHRNTYRHTRPEETDPGRTQ